MREIGTYFEDLSPEEKAELTTEVETWRGVQVCCGSFPQDCHCTTPIHATDLDAFLTHTAYDGAIIPDCAHCFHYGEASCPPLRKFAREYLAPMSQDVELIQPCNKFIRID